jgi:hypothetical protein
MAALAAVIAIPNTATSQNAATEAPTGFDNRTNGFTEQGPPLDQLNEDNVVPRRSFNDNLFIFGESEAVEDGLGPTYNAQSCRECHQNVVTGGSSQITELRSGRYQNGKFHEALGGTLIQSRATHPDIVEYVSMEDDVRAFRLATNTLGNGFVECIDDTTLIAIRDAQPSELRGTAVMAPVLEAGDSPRVGRFGWKSQHASLQSFAADAYLNEMGITTPLFPEENTSNGRDVGRYDPVDDPEDDGVGVLAFADFMRSTKAPPQPTFAPENRCSTRSAAPAATRPRSRRRLRARRSTAERSRSLPLSATRSFTLTAIICCTMSALATVFPL